MRTYTVYIESTEYYAIKVQARDKEDAGDKAWNLFPHQKAEYGETNITEINDEGEIE
jgi:hypothetical protein